MAEVVIGIAASHAPNLAIPSLVGKVDEGQQKRVMAGFGEARNLLEQARPDAIVIFSTDHFDRCFYDNLPPFLVAVGETAEGPVNEWLKIPKVKLRVAGEWKVSGQRRVRERGGLCLVGRFRARPCRGSATLVPHSPLGYSHRTYCGQCLCAADAEPQALHAGGGVCP